MEKTAAIIHGRTRYGDYREKLLVHPADMTEEEVYVWKQRLLRCTKDPEEMRAGHQIRRAVICDGVYLLTGVAAYFRDLCTGSFEDEGGRPVYGFVGFIWKREAESAGMDVCPFPALQDFSNLVKQYVIPRWEEPKNGVDVEKATLSDYQEYQFCLPEGDVTEWEKREMVWLKRECENGEYAIEKQMLQQALKRAESGTEVFYCTGLPEEEQVIRSAPVRQDRGSREYLSYYVRCLAGAAVLLLSLAAALFLPPVSAKLTAGILVLFFLYRIVTNLRQLTDICRGENQARHSADMATGLRETAGEERQNIQD